jgi:hypothetical protein
LKDISNSNANLVIKTIHEEIPAIGNENTTGIMNIKNDTLVWGIVIFVTFVLIVLNIWTGLKRISKRRKR